MIGKVNLKKLDLYKCLPVKPAVPPSATSKGDISRSTATFDATHPNSHSSPALELVRAALEQKRRDELARNVSTRAHKRVASVSKRNQAQPPSGKRRMCTLQALLLRRIESRSISGGV